MPDEPTDTQKSQPRPRKKGKKVPEPIEIPAPSKSQIMRDFEKVATPDDNPFAELSDDELCSQIRAAMPPPATAALPHNKDIEAREVGDVAQLLAEANRRNIDCLGEQPPDEANPR